MKLVLFSVSPSRHAGNSIPVLAVSPFSPGSPAPLMGGREQVRRDNIWSIDSSDKMNIDRALNR
jgi:hypothetical protein